LSSNRGIFFRSIAPTIKQETSNLPGITRRVELELLQVVEGKGPEGLEVLAAGGERPWGAPKVELLLRRQGHLQQAPKKARGSESFKRFTKESAVGKQLINKRW